MTNIIHSEMMEMSLYGLDYLLFFWFQLLTSVDWNHFKALGETKERKKQKKETEERKTERKKERKGKLGKDIDKNTKVKL